MISDFAVPDHKLTSHTLPRTTSIHRYSSYHGHGHASSHAYHASSHPQHQNYSTRSNLRRSQSNNTESELSKMFNVLRLKNFCQPKKKKHLHGDRERQGSSSGAAAEDDRDKSKSSLFRTASNSFAQCGLSKSKSSSQKVTLSGYIPDNNDLFGDSKHAIEASARLSKTQSMKLSVRRSESLSLSLSNNKTKRMSLRGRRLGTRN